MHYQRNLLQKKIYVRGGIADGQCYCDDHVIFSKALIKAYKLETEIAKYPRIVIEKNILTYLNKNFNEHIFRGLLKKYIVKDWTGISFLNPFKMIESINEMFEKIPEMRPYVQRIMDENITVINENMSPDMFDNQLIKFIFDDLNLKLKKYKKIPEIHEKYLWLREFVYWNDDIYSKIEFTYSYR
jgi:hypothetical protein